MEFDRKESKKEEEPIEEKTDAEIVADAMKEDPYEKFGEQIQIDDGYDLPF